MNLNDDTLLENAGETKTLAEFAFLTAQATGESHDAARAGIIAATEARRIYRIV